MPQKVFTTGEVAKICQVSRPTVLKWYEEGLLKGYATPGSKHCRFTYNELRNFMDTHGFPLEALNETDETRILVVDDDEAIVNVIEKVLTEKGGYTVKSARNGYDAGLLTDSFRPDLILLDIRLPDIDGRQVCERLRQDPEYKGIRIVAISGYSGEEQIEQIMQSGFDSFIPKPFEGDQLLSKVAELIAR